MIEARDTVIDWLLDSDPSIRWQVMRDLTDTPDQVVAAERARVAVEGWGARLLAEQRSDGQWGDGVQTPFWWTNMYTLVFLVTFSRTRSIALRAGPLAGSISCARMSPGARSSAIHRSSKERSSRASTVASSHSARISTSAAIDSSTDC